MKTLLRSTSIFLLFVLSFSTCNKEQNIVEPAPSIGSVFGGGIVFYIDNTGLHGLAASFSDQSAFAVWCDETAEIDGADGTEIGTGMQNTQDILDNCTSSGSAASICANLSLNGHSDWYLPSIDELEALYNARAAVDSTALSNGGTAFMVGAYWSSTEGNFGSNTSALIYSFEFGVEGSLTKFGTAKLRAIRSF